MITLAEPRVRDIRDKEAIYLASRYFDEYVSTELGDVSLDVRTTLRMEYIENALDSPELLDFYRDQFEEFPATFIGNIECYVKNAYGINSALRSKLLKGIRRNDRNLIVSLLESEYESLIEPHVKKNILISV